MIEMTWEQKLEALEAIGDVNLRMRKPGDWYVSHRAAVVWSCFSGGPYGNGTTPQEAVENHWRIFATLKSSGYDQLDCVKTAEGKHVRWNGYRWADYSRRLS